MQHDPRFLARRPLPRALRCAPHRLAALLLGVLGGLAPIAAAHGGVVPPPPPGPGGSWGGPGDTASGGPRPAGPFAGPAPGSPASPAPTAPAPAAPGSPAGAPAAPSSPASLAAAPSTAIDYGSWRWWWEFNKEPFLLLPSKRRSVTTVGETWFLGRGEVLLPRDGLGAATSVGERVVPALLEALGDRSNDVQSAALVALARIGADRTSAHADALRPAFATCLTSSSQEVAETAAAATGILADAASTPLLAELVLDTPRGRQAVGDGRVSVRTRAFAAYGLGLAAHEAGNEDLRRYAVHKLAAALDADDTATDDLGVACVLAMGRAPIAWSGRPAVTEGAAESPTDGAVGASREAQLAYLLGLLDRRDLQRGVRAHVPIALGSLATPPAEAPAGADERTRLERALQRDAARTWKERLAGELVRAVSSRPGNKTPFEERVSAAIALGELGDDDNDVVDRAIREALMGVDDGDPVLRRLAWISLGRIGARRGEGAPTGVADVRAFLMKRLAKGPEENADWCTLALALLERGRADLGQPPEPEVVHALQLRLREAKSPSTLGATAIACGILGDLDATEALLEHLAQQNDEQSLGEVALALGLLQVPDAIEPVRALVDRSTYRPRLLRDSALALGLLGDRTAVELLTTKLERASSLAAQAAIAQALGRIGDSRAFDPLLAMLVDRQLTDRARAFAAVALGLIAERDELPWGAVLSVGCNYVAAPPTLFDHTGFGILNIL